MIHAIQSHLYAVPAFLLLGVIAPLVMLAFLVALYALPAVAIAHFGWGHYPPLRWRKYYPLNPKHPVAEELHPTLKKLLDASDVIIKMPRQ